MKIIINYFYIILYLLTGSLYSEVKVIFPHIKPKVHFDKVFRTDDRHANYKFKIFDKDGWKELLIDATLLVEILEENDFILFNENKKGELFANILEQHLSNKNDLYLLKTINPETKEWSNNLSENSLRNILISIRYPDYFFKFDFFIYEKYYFTYCEKGKHLRFYLTENEIRNISKEFLIDPIIEEPSGNYILTAISLGELIQYFLINHHIKLFHLEIRDEQAVKFIFSKNTFNIEGQKLINQNIIIQPTDVLEFKLKKYYNYIFLQGGRFRFISFPFDYIRTSLDEIIDESKIDTNFQSFFINILYRYIRLGNKVKFEIMKGEENNRIPLLMLDRKVLKDLKTPTFHYEMNRSCIKVFNGKLK